MQTEILENDVISEIPTTADGILEKAKFIVPILRENSERIEKNRKLPDNIVQILRNTGVFRAAMPKEWGGQN